MGITWVESTGLPHWDFTSSKRDSLRAERINVFPLPDNALAKAFPIPEEAPVIHTIWLLIFMS
jgi:hypothetical protein